MKLRHLLPIVLLAGLILAAPARAVVGHSFEGSGPAAGKKFWTPDRVSRALERDPVFGAAESGSSDQAGPATSPGLQAHHRPVTVSRPEVGKILGWDKYGGYSCTGSVLDTPSLRLVLTAGHCVFADGVWARTMLFIPDFKNGRRPYGTYVVKTAWVANWWQRFSYGSYGTNFDIAILVTHKTANGSRVGQNVGAIPYRAFPNRAGLTDIYGYPAAAMRGLKMRTCRSRTKADWYGGRFFPGPTGLLARCNMAAGSSGGPWVSRYDNGKGGTIGMIDGLTSTGYAQAGHNYLTSPYFGRILVRLIKASEGR